MTALEDLHGAAEVRARDNDLDARPVDRSLARLVTDGAGRTELAVP
jgi:hypothetical protein